jgi:hypothetical protein
MDLLLALENALKAGDITRIAKALDDLQDLLGKLTHFENTYYGPLATAPTTRPDGTTKPQEGDLYYDLTKGGLHVYENGAWAPVGANQNQIEVFHLTDKDVKPSGTKLSLRTPYQPGNNQLLVFVNATFQYPITKQTPDGAYTESSERGINFPPDTLEVGDVVTVVKGNVVTSIDHVMAVDIENYRTVLPNEKLITIPGGMTYIPGVNNLEVFVNGQHMLPGIDYVETDGTHVTFTSNLPQGALITFKRGNIIGSNYTTGTDGVIVDTLNIAAEFKTRGHALRTDGIVVLLGYANANDGGGGIFIYDKAKDRREANGGSVIDATVDLASQGAGTGIGCWVRLYTNEVKPQWWGAQKPLVKDMALLGKGQPGDIVTVYGYHEDGDGGEGQFYWDDTQPKRNHDGGTVIDPEKTYPSTWNNAAQMNDWFTAINSTRTGCWVRLNLDSANIVWFGAKADGTDNGPVLRGVTRSINSGLIRELRIPVGTFEVTSAGALLIQNIPGMFRLHGDGPDSVLQFNTGANPSALTLIDDSHVIVESLTLKDTRAAGNNIALNVMNSSDVDVRNCVFDGFTGSAMKVAENVAANTAAACNNISFRNNEVIRCGTDNQHVLDINPKVLSRNVNVYDNSFEQCGSTGFAAIAYLSACIESNIRNNTMSAIAGSCIKIQGYEDVECVDNTLEDFGEHAIVLDVSNSPNYLNPGLKFCKIADNVILFPKPTATYAVYIEGQVNNTAQTNGPVEITNNSITGCGGIHISPQVALGKLDIFSNRIKAVPNNYFGLFADQANGGSLDQVMIRENMFEDATGTRQDAMVSLEQARKCIVEGNFMKQSGQSDLLLQNCNDAEVRNNIFMESNVSNIAGHACIDIQDNTTANYTLKGNQIIPGVSGNPKGLFSVNSNQPVIRVSSNLLGAGNIPVTISNANIVSDSTDAVLQLGGVRHFYGTGVPAAGDYNVGDMIWNSLPAAGGSVGWICTTAGAPGTWKTFGTIAP